MVRAVTCPHDLRIEKLFIGKALAGLLDLGVIGAEMHRHQSRASIREPVFLQQIRGQTLLQMLIEELKRVVHDSAQLRLSESLGQGIDRQYFTALPKIPTLFFAIIQ